ncbi:MAG: TIGR01457 family HAD-type hydrolase [Armatimonadota bacterium]
MNPHKSYILDMDGVLIRGNTAISGAQEFIENLIKKDIKFIILTNNPMYTPRDLQYKLKNSGLNVPFDHIFTSAMATAKFLHQQNPNGSAFVIGETGLHVAMHEVGYVITDKNPDYFVLGETTNYDFEKIRKAIQLVADGALFIATNPDAAGPSEKGLAPACGAMAALIEKATGISPYFVGKPNPLMMRTALRFLGAHSEDTIMVGDSMNTDILTGIESGMETILVLTGVTTREQISKYPFRPARIISSLDEIELD